MKVVARVFSVSLFMVVLGGMLVVPASADPVDTINLPSGSWNVTVQVTSSETGHDLSFGLLQGESQTQACPTNDNSTCQVGDAATYTGLSGEALFYLGDLTCGETFQSNDPDHSAIDQTDSTHWTIGWDDSGAPCDNQDFDYNDLVVSVTAWQPGSNSDFAATDYTGTQTSVSTVFATGDQMKTTVKAPNSTGVDGYQNGAIIDQELPPSQFAGFCGGVDCDAQVEKLQMPSGSQPDAPLKLFLIYRGTARNGNAVYAQGDNESSPHLLSLCDKASVARVNGTPAKCVASITLKTHIKRIVVNIPDGGDPLCGKH